MTARQSNRIVCAARGSDRTACWPAFCAIGLAFVVLTLTHSPPALAQASGGETGTLLPLPEIQTRGAEEGAAGPEIARLKDALQQMNTQNPVVARVDGHEIRWAEVVESAGDLPLRYREQIETVFPALLDRLVDLRLLANAARGQGLRDDPVVRERIARYEDRVLSGVLLERYLDNKVTTAVLRERYDALVAEKRRDSEIRARHILVESEEAAVSIVKKLESGAVFISLATEFSSGASASRGGDLGYFHPSRMDPSFAEAALALEPGDYTRDPVETAFGWHVILLVDRRADNIPSFIDMQASLRDEARKEAMDRLVFGLRSEAQVEMFPEDALDEKGAPATQSDASQ